MTKVKLTIAGILLAIVSWLVGGITAPKNLGSIGSRDAYTYTAYSSTNASSTVGTIVALGSDRILGSIIVGTTHATQIRLYDNSTSATSTGTLIGTLKASIVENTYVFDTTVKKGIVIELPAGYAGNLTITYK